MCLFSNFELETTSTQTLFLIYEYSNKTSKGSAQKSYASLKKETLIFQAIYELFENEAILYGLD
jgi:hypothetical protein